MAKDNVIGLSIGLDTSSLKAGLQDASRRLKETNAEFKASTSGMDDWASTSEGLQAKLKQLNSTLDIQKAALDLMQKEYDEVYKGQDENSAAASKLRTQILNQQAAIGATEKDLRKFNEKLEEVEKSEKETEDAVEDVNKDLKEQKEVAEDAGDGFTVIKGAMANLLSAGVEKLIDGLGKLKDAFFDAIGNADDLLTTSAQTGIAVDKLQELQYAAELVDVSVETVTKSMAKNIKSMKAVQDGTKLSVEAYEKLGVAVLDADGNMRDGETVYWEVIDALGQMENETERDAVAMQILGKSAQDLNPLIQAGSDTMSELADEAHRTGYVMSEETIGALGEADDVVQRAKVGWEGFKNQLIATLLSEVDLEKAQEFVNDALTTLKDDIIPKVIEAFKWLKDNIPTITGYVIALGAAYAGFKIVGIVNGIVKAMKAWTAATTGMTLAQKLLNLAMKSNPIGLIVGLIAGLIAYIIYLWQTNDEFKAAVIAAWEAVKNFFINVGKAIADGFNWMVEKISELWTNFMNWLSEVLPKIGQWFSDLWNNVTTWVSESVSSIGTFFSDLWTKITDIFSSIGTWFSEKFTEAWEAIKTAFGKVGSFFSGIWETIKEKFTDIGQKVGDSISAAFKKAINAVLTAAEKVLNFPINSINKIITTINDMVGTNWGTLGTIELPQLAKGGIVNKATLGIFGEAGTEAVIPLERNLGWIKQLSANIVKELPVESLAGVANATSNVNNNFTQIINTPKAPPLDDVYRMSRNLLNVKAVTN